MCIIIFSSNERGGLLQMATNITEILISLNKKVKCYIPLDSETTISDTISPYIVRYRKAKSINLYNNAARAVAKDILKSKPSIIWHIDNAIFTSQVGILLGKKVKQILVMHDAGTSHSTYQNSILSKLKHFIGKCFSKLCNNRMYRIILCSPNSLKTYTQLYPSHKDKVYLLPLGSHMPNVNSKVPPEIQNVENPLLFFGRIDKYKGIDTLLRTYSQWGGNRHLVIAGQGILMDEELNYIKKDHRIILINRFITDEEMVYLLKNSRALILPYKDATQSGILPMAYLCGKPIICSDVEGITQFVTHNITGIICKDDKDYLNAYDNIENDNIVGLMANSVQNYYWSNLDCKVNVIKMLKSMNMY
jgi:glycosyltransferase involved in cell wall biosynthesis